MTRKVPTPEQEAILAVLAQYPDGLGVAQLLDVLAPRLIKPLSRRTLQRRLDGLLAELHIASQGESVARVYKVRTEVAVVQRQAAAADAKASAALLDADFYMPLSLVGAQIRDEVRRPLMHRRPVGYNRAFLEAYEPGVTWYLSEPLRAQLHEMGRTPADQRAAGTYARDIFNRLLVDLSWASSRLEGNTYTRLDTQNLIEFGQVAKGKDAQETQMILNHKAAIEMLVEDADEVACDVFTIQNLHAVLSQNLMREDAASGRLRRRPVEISGTVFYPLAMPQVLEDCFRLLLNKAHAIADPFEQAFFLMVQIPYLQPFEDVNKRVSRLGANIPLIKHNLCPLSFIDVPERAYIEGTLGVYEHNRIELLRDVFVWAYERSCQRYLAITQSLAEPNPLKMQYRDALIDAVQAVVRSGQAPTASLIQRLAHESVPGKDTEAFAGLLADALAQLHEGSVARYRLKRSEFVAWRGD